MSTESVRQRKVADKIKQLISVIIDRKVNDPDKGFTTVTHVRVSKDLRIAYVYVTVLGDENSADKTLAALERATNFIRNEIAPELKMRFVPELRFFLDDTMSYAKKIDEILETIKKEDNEK